MQNNWYNLAIGQKDDGEYIVSVYDSNGLWKEQYESDELENAFRHALHSTWPILAARIFPDYFEWIQNHKIQIEDEEIANDD